jgi:DNA polymerase III delta prime subunit
MRTDEARELFRQAIAARRLAHAYLLVGAPRGVAGELAVDLMQRLACLDPEQAPCGTCDRCRQVAAHTWCDNFWVFPIKKSRVISIEQMRETPGSKVDPPYFLPWLGGTAFAGGWKVGVLAGADRLTEGAANAFLKMLEEPPPETLILLLSDAPQALLPTIRSRCQRLDLDAPPPELDEPWRSGLLAILAAEGSAGPVAAMAAGDRIQQILLAMKDRAAELVREEIAAEGNDGAATAEHGDGDEPGPEASEPDEEPDEGPREGKADTDQAVIEARVSARYRELRTLLLVSLQRWYRDLLALRAGAPSATIHYQSHLAVLQARAQRLTLAQALANIEGLEALARQMERSLAERPLLAYWMDRLAGGAA